MGVFMKIQIPMSILLYIFAGGCNNVTVKSIETRKLENKPSSFIMFTTAREITLNRTGLEGISFGISMEDTFIILKKMRVKYYAIKGSYHPGIKIINTKLYGIDVPVTILEYDVSGKLDKFIINTGTSSWENTIDKINIINNKVTAIYGKPVIVNIPNEGYYERNNTLNQIFVEWPIVNRRYIVSTVYMQENGYNADLLIFDPISAIHKPVATTSSCRPVLLSS
jgi:hypothetical protein